MSHNVIVGGFASSERQMEVVASALATYYDEEFDGISFREAMGDKERIGSLARDANFYTHSAGMIAIRHTSPDAIIAVAPPLPVLPHNLVACTIASALEFTANSVLCGELGDRACIHDTIYELIGHMYGNMKWLGHIAAFDSIQAGIAAQEAGITTSLAFMERDRLFQPRPEELVRARESGVYAVILPGAHEQLISAPRRTIDAYENGVQPDAMLASIV